MIINVAKNTTKHLVKIMDVLSDAGIRVFMSISLQTTDERTLGSIHRSKISTDHYRRLAAALRRRGHPLIGELMIGLPGQTVDSAHGDLQFVFGLRSATANIGDTDASEQSDERALSS
ncbi:MAG: hypothetical protein M5U19_20285 [Microthrixaceae bacterium]|nr:hypothetical protein [Microthrixaceae bacterium]